MSKYIIEFSKTGTICYTSHLDLMRIFKRVFKRTGIALAYSQGFNPHPKMGFAQPLSLGYWGMEEYIEFETAEEWQPDQLLQRLAGECGIALNYEQYVLVGSTVRSYLSWLKDSGRISAFFEDNMLLWQRVQARDYTAG